MAVKPWDLLKKNNYTNEEIAQAQAEQAARDAGVEEGIEQGKQEGFAQALETYDF